MLEFHVDTLDGIPVPSAIVKLTYNGEQSILANTDDKGIAVFYGVPTGTEISYKIMAKKFHEATGNLIIPTKAEYEIESVILSPITIYHPHD